MTKSAKRSIIISAVLAIIMCASLIAGATFALFTSERKVNIAVTSGKVDVVATIDDLITYSGSGLTGDVTKDEKKITETKTNGQFTNGGTANITGNILTLDKMTPGDRVTASIKIENRSNVAVKYRTVITCTADDGLFEGLKVTIGDQTFEGITKKGDWASLEAGAAITSATVPVTIELPTDAGNDYLDKTCTISYIVEAIQGNAETTNPDPNVIEIGNAIELNLFRASINKNNALYKGKTVKLTADIDLKGAEWTPIVIQQNGADGMIFDGNGKTIKNFTVIGRESENNKQDDGVGFFKHTHLITIRDLTLKNATVTGNNKVGALVGKGWTTTITDCKVIDSSITSSTRWDPTLNKGEGDWDDGDKAGALAGYLGEGGNEVSGCTVSNCTVKGYRDVGGLIGIIDIAGTGNVISDNELNLTVINDRSHNPKDYKEDAEYDVKNIVGEYTTNNTMISEKTTNVKIIIEYADGFTNETNTTVYNISNVNGLKYFRDTINAKKAPYGTKVTVNLTDDIDLKGEEWTPIDWADNVGSLFDGNDHTISNLTITQEKEKDLGLFGKPWSLTITNLTIDGANVTGLGRVGAIVGKGLCTYIDDCHVKNSIITACAADNDDGDKAGAIAGQLSAEQSCTVTNCTVTDCNITASRDVGGLVGHVNGGKKTTTDGEGWTVTNNKVTKTQVINDRSVPAGSIAATEYNYGQIVGRHVGTLDNSNTASNDVTVTVVPAVWKVTPENVQDYLDGIYGSLDGVTLVLTAGDYGKLELGRATKSAGSNTKYYNTNAGFGGTPVSYGTFSEGRDHPYRYYLRTINNLTIKAETGKAVTVAGLEMTSGHRYGTTGNPCRDYVLDDSTEGTNNSYYLAHVVKGIRFEGITFTAKCNIATSSAATTIEDITFENCVFDINNTAAGNQAINYSAESNSGTVKNLVVEGCTFNSCYQGVYTRNACGVTVSRCIFNTTGHNAIAIQDDATFNHGAVVITSNTFNNINDRIIRFGNVGAGTQITITGNTATNSGEVQSDASKVAIIKAQSLADGITYSISGNNWGTTNAIFQDGSNNEIETFKDAVA